MYIKVSDILLQAPKPPRPTEMYINVSDPQPPKSPKPQAASQT